MKFSHSIQFNAVPDWSSHYIAYSSLKKLIYTLEKTIYQPSHADLETRPLVQNADPEEVFTRALDVEVEKITSFYQIKEKELLDEVTDLLRDVATLQELGTGDNEESILERGTGFRSINPTLEHVRQLNRAGASRSVRSNEDELDDSEDSADDDETVGLTRKRRASVGFSNGAGGANGSRRRQTHDMTASTDMGKSITSLRRTSTAFDDYAELEQLYSSKVMIKRRVISLYVQVCELKSFVQLNKTGFRKVLKKFDKIIDRKLRPKYTAASVDTAYVFKSETLLRIEGTIVKLEQAYTEIVADGDSELARKDLRSHLREHVVWERNTVWRDLIGLERRAEAATVGRSLLGAPTDNRTTRLQGDDAPLPSTKEISTPLGRFTCPSWVLGKPMLTLIIIVAVFLLLLYIPITSLPEQQNCLALLVFVSLLWATEAIPLFATSLLVPFLCITLQVVRSDDPPHVRLGPKAATTYIFSAMWTPVIMLLLGGFTVAAALSKMKIDKRLATFILSKAGTRPRTVLIANMFVAAFASMLVSNVAAPVLCFSIIEPVLRNLPPGSDMSKAIIMGIALASNIGGMLSPIASPQNVVAVGIMEPPPTWGQWFFIVIPVGIVSILLIWFLLLITFQPSKGTTIVPIRAARESFSFTDWYVAGICVATIALWCASHQLESTFGDMGVIAIIPIVLFFALGPLTKEDFNAFPWTIIILAAGGLSLGKAVNSSGLLHTVAEGISREVEDMHLYWVLLIFSALALVVATFISHTVAALIILPLVSDIGKAMEEPHPNLLIMGATLMCSAAMALPTSGFPNMTAIMKEDATGQRYLEVKHFISRGVPSSLITLAVVVTLGYGAMRIIGM